MPGKQGRMFREWKDETAKHEAKHRRRNNRFRGMRQEKRKDRRLHLELIYSDECQDIEIQIRPSDLK